MLDIIPSVQTLRNDFLKTEENILREIWLPHFVLLSVFCFCSIPVFPLTFFLLYLFIYHAK